MDEDNTGMGMPANATPEDLRDTGEMYRVAARIRDAHGDILEAQAARALAIGSKDEPARAHADAQIERGEVEMAQGKLEIDGLLAKMMERNGCTSISELIEGEHLWATAADDILHADEVPVDPEMEAQFWGLDEAD